MTIGTPAGRAQDDVVTAGLGVFGDDRVRGAW